MGSAILPIASVSRHPLSTASLSQCFYFPLPDHSVLPCLTVTLLISQSYHLSALMHRCIFALMPQGPTTSILQCASVSLHLCLTDFLSTAPLLYSSLPLPDCPTGSPTPFSTVSLLHRPITSLIAVSLPRRSIGPLHHGPLSGVAPLPHCFSALLPHCPNCNTSLPHSPTALLTCLAGPTARLQYCPNCPYHSVLHFYSLTAQLAYCLTVPMPYCPSPNLSALF